MVEAGLQAAAQKQGNNWHHFRTSVDFTAGLQTLLVVSTALEMPKEGLGLWEYSREGCHMKLCRLLCFCEPVEGTSGLVLAEVLLPCSAQAYPLKQQ